MLRARIDRLPAPTCRPRSSATTSWRATIDTSDAWIVERTGIRQRHIAAAGELTSDLASAAARGGAAARRDRPGAARSDQVLATSTPDHTFPACATAVQRKLGAWFGPRPSTSQAVCSGFVYALAVADNFLDAGSGARPRW